MVWNVTHEVFPDESSSLMGRDENPFANEGIELNKNDRVFADDEDIFQSRRGANQENHERRAKDKLGHLTNKWLRLKAVFNKKVTGHGYVRAETIALAKGEEERNDILADIVNEKTAKATGDVIYAAWVRLRKKRRMSKGAWEHWEKVRDEKSEESSPSWDQIEEGHDVSKSMSNESEWPNYEEFEQKSNQAIIRAIDKKTGTPVGIIVIERRATMKFPRYNDNANKKWYLRWLIGHPTLKGAGGLLMARALQHVKENVGSAVWVHSAPSAVGWYAGKGFELLSMETQKGMDDSYETGWDSPLMVKDL